MGFMSVMVVLLWGFSSAFAVSMPTSTAFFNTNTTVVPGLVTTWFAMVGDFQVSDYSSGLSLSMFVIFQVIVIIVMFNVLIAIVSDRYNEVMETAEVEVRKLRALMIVEEQALMSSAEKRDEQYFPPYLEVLQSNVQPSSSSELSELRGEVRKVERRGRRGWQSVGVHRSR